MNTVVYTAKQKLFKQFTTLNFITKSLFLLLFILRSRNFSSNSQQAPQRLFFIKNCCLYCEAETFQAIHNAYKNQKKCVVTVVYTAKQKLFKQFTTKVTDIQMQYNCCLYCEAETFQAIHNYN